MEKIRLKAAPRPQKSTRKSLSDLRKKLQVPAVVYGGSGKKNLSVSVAEKDVVDALKKGGANAVIHLQHEKGEDTVIVKEFQRHVVTGWPMHIDFQRISLKVAIEVKVAIHVKGEPVGVKQHGGVLEHILREIEVKGLPDKIPQRIDLDVSPLEIGQGVAVKQLSVPSDIEVLEDPEKIVVNVVQAMKEEEAAPAPEAVEGAEGAEPEVIAKGKKEEGAEGEKAAEGEKKGEKKEPAAKGEAKKEQPKKEKSK